VMYLVTDWSVSSEPSWSHHRMIHFALHLIQIREKWGNTRQIDCMGNMADLQIQMSKALSRFHTK
jgi:hypothetical protein